MGRKNSFSELKSRNLPEVKRRPGERTVIDSQSDRRARKADLTLMQKRVFLGLCGTRWDKVVIPRPVARSE
jgi:hypothetical protein